MMRTESFEGWTINHRVVTDRAGGISRLTTFEVDAKCPCGATFLCMDDVTARGSCDHHASPTLRKRVQDIVRILQASVGKPYDGNQP